VSGEPANCGNKFKIWAFKKWKYFTRTYTQYLNLSDGSTFHRSRISILKEGEERRLMSAAVKITSRKSNTRGLISLWLYKENNKLLD
jgi:hypothetical protein